MATVLQVLPALEVGGVERGTVDMTRALTEAGWHAVVASSGGAMVNEIRRCGGVHVTLPLATKNPWTILNNARRLADIVKVHAVDIIHARSRAPGWSSYLAARRTTLPFVTTFHGIYGHGNSVKRLYNGIMARGDIVIAGSYFTARHVETTYRTPPARLRVIHRGIDADVLDPDKISDQARADLAAQWGVANRMSIILLPGRATRLKGHRVLIDAVRQLDRDDVRVFLVGANQGKSRYRTELEDRIRRHRLEGVIHLTPPCRDMAVAYGLADIVVAPSIKPEAFGRVIVEAQAMGCPVIATRLGGACETIVADQTGWLVPAQDAAALAAAMRQALGMTIKERLEYAKRARAHVLANFTKSRMCERTLHVYRELLASSSSNADA